MKSYAHLRGAVCVIALAAPAQHASAQDVTAPGAVVSGTNKSSSGGEIIVTAQRRSERLTDVPLTVSAISSDQLEKRNITNTQGLQRVTAGLQLTSYGAWSEPSLRGVSSDISSSGASPNVAFYLDGIYQPTELGQLMNLPDVKDVEVLKGPQGTLYGQNSVGGAIIINTLTPSFTLSGKASLAYGNYNDKQAKGYITGPIVDGLLAGSLAGSWEDHDGFRRGVTSNKRDKGLDVGLVRGKLLFTPASSLKFTLTGYWTRTSDTATYEGQAFEGLTVGSKIVPNEVDPSDRQLTSVEPFLPATTLRSWGVSLRSQLQTDVGEFESVSSYSNNQSKVYADVDYSPANIATAYLRAQSHAFIQEVHFFSKKIAGFKLTAGLFYQNSFEAFNPSEFALYDSGIGLAPTVYPTTPNVQFIAQRARTRSRNEFIAGFADLSYDLGDRIVLTAGGRYTHQRMTGGFSPDSIAPAAPVEGSPANWGNFSPRFTARFKLTDNSNVYASYTKGFKAGLLAVAPSGAPADPETIASYEIGYKGLLAEGLHLNLSGFWADHKNKQVSFYDPPTVVTQNAASVRLKGIDADVTLDLSREFSLTASAEYLDAKYRSFPSAAIFVPNPATGGIQQISVDLSGHRVDRAPKFTTTVSANYHEQFDAGTVDASASVYHSSLVLWDAGGLVRQRAYELVDAQIGFVPASLSKVRFSIYGSNLTNTHYLGSFLESAFAAGVSYSPPRQFGGRVEFKF